MKIEGRQARLTALRRSFAFSLGYRSAPFSADRIPSHPGGYQRQHDLLSPKAVFRLRNSGGVARKPQEPAIPITSDRFKLGESRHVNKKHPQAAPCITGVIACCVICELGS
jgi:hypothetical protein